MNPMHYAGGASGAAMLAIVLTIFFPKLTNDQAAAAAGLAFMAIAAIHAAVKAYLPPKA